MAKNILLVSGASPEEQRLAAILGEINFGVFLENDLGRIKSLTQQKSFQMVILFERGAREQVVAIESWLQEIRHKGISILWVVPPTFAQEHDFLKKDQILLWPMDVDLVIDAIENSIGLPNPPEERTLKIDEGEIVPRAAPPKREPPPSPPAREDATNAAKWVDAQKREATYLQDIQGLREDLRRAREELQREQARADEVRAVLAQLTEAMKK